MSTLVINPTYQSLDVLFEADLDSIRVPLQDFLNITKVSGDNFADRSLTTANLDATTQFLVVLSGTQLPFYGATLPTGYLWCDGTLYNTQEHPELYNVIVTTYGGSPGVNFNVPDKRGRTGLGQDNMGGSAANRVTVGSTGVAADTIGATGGSQTLSSHTHAPGFVTVSPTLHANALDPVTHTHPTFSEGAAGGISAFFLDRSTNNVGTTTNSANGTTDAVVPNITYTTTGSQHTHAGDFVVVGSTTSTGTNPNQSVVQPSIVCNWIIKT